MTAFLVGESPDLHGEPWDSGEAPLVARDHPESPSQCRRADDQVVRQRLDYELAKIAEYWIVDLQLTQILVLELHEGEYRKHGPFRRDDIAQSFLISGFQLSVRDLFAAGGVV